MLDMLPFLRVSGNSPEEQIGSIVNYLTQFKETLEFVLMNISTENLSPDLIKQLNELGANIQKNKEEREDEVAQMANKSFITVSDVCNSDLFKFYVSSEISKRVSFNVNFETGHLEYNTSDEEVNNGL